MVYVETGEPNGQRRRDVPLQPSQMGIDEDLLKDVLKRVRERRSRTHPLPTPRPNGSNRVGLGHGAQQKPARPGARPTMRLTDDLCCMDFRCFEVLGMGAKPRQRLLLRNGSAIEENLHGRAISPPEQRDPESNGWTHSQDRSATPSEQRDSELNGSSRSQHSSRWSRNGHVLGLPTLRSYRNPNVKTSMAEVRRPSIKDKGLASGRPSVGSRVNGVPNRNLAWRAPTASAVGNKRVSKPSGFQSTLNPKTSQQGHVRPVPAAKHGGSSGSNFALHPSSTARNPHAPKSAGNYSMTRNEQVSAVPGTRSKSSPSREPPVSTNARIQQVSKPPPGVPSKWNVNTRMEGRGGVWYASEQGESHASGSKFSLHSEKPARSKSPAIQSIFQGKAWRKKQGGTESVGNDGSSSATGLHSTGTPPSSNPTVRARWNPLKSHVVQQEVSTGANPAKLPTVESSSNASSHPSNASLASSKNSSKGNGSNKSDSKSSSSRDLGVFLHLTGTSGSYDSEADSVSDLSLPSTSTAQTRNSAPDSTTSDALNPVNLDEEREGSYDTGDGDSYSYDDSSAGSQTTFGESGKVVDSIRATANDILDVEDVWLSRAVLKTIAESKEVSVDELIEIVCDKLDEIDETLFRCDGRSKTLRIA